jgi:hypothetical protein
MDGEVFFVGNATGDQATSGNHPPYWKTYVEDVLKNRYEMEILIDNIDLESAIRIKDEVMRIFADQVINLQNFHRQFNMEIFNVYSESMKLYDKFLGEGIAIEKKGKIDQAITAYETACTHYIKAVNSRHYDCNEEYLKAHTPIPATKLVDRISLCYLKSNRYKDLIDFSENYFRTFLRKEKTGGEKNMIKRVEKAKEGIKGQLSIFHF